MKVWVLLLVAFALFGLVIAIPFSSGPSSSYLHSKVGRAVGGTAIKHQWKSTEAYRLFNIRKRAGRQAMFKFRRYLAKWRKARQECVNNSNCSDYLNATKDMIHFGIDVAIAKLKTLDAPETESLIDKLISYKEQILNAESIDEIREIYPEVRETVREANMMFRRKALVDLIDVYSIILDGLSDKYPEEVSELQSRLSDLKESIYTLNVSEIVRELKEIRGAIIALYRG